MSDEHFMAALYPKGPLQAISYIRMLRRLIRGGLAIECMQMQANLVPLVFIAAIILVVGIGIAGYIANKKHMEAFLSQSHGCRQFMTG